MKVSVIIPAAGLGTRMSAAARSKNKKEVISKQFTALRGVPMLIRTLRVFAAHPRIDELVVVLRKDEIPGFQARLDKEEREISKKKVSLVEGGEHRQESVTNGLNSLRSEPDDIVLVHDAVRPFVDDSMIDEVIGAAGKYGAAIVGLPAVDTIKQVDRTAEGALITATIPRERVVMAQTPQGFRYSIIKKAFDDAAADGFVGTDEASLVERARYPVAVVMGSPRNLKITTPADLELAEFYLEKR
ncbi:MAG TPA: 2-C-methyl-D-erythritol 4-phosphate cytidylyltransferase [Terriglobales bacterium]|jgi:2-C-methyl-D-erythritol 4-phosphate cytidylyltransferase|nr:2-C-methyl-D-erythritol 4-phosphate cytidylyltransferase [Terriglobales bacterium]